MIQARTSSLVSDKSPMQSLSTRSPSRLLLQGVGTFSISCRTLGQSLLLIDEEEQRQKQIDFGTEKCIRIMPRETAIHEGNCFFMPVNQKNQHRQQNTNKKIWPMAYLLEQHCASNLEGSKLKNITLPKSPLLLSMCSYEILISVSVIKCNTQ